MSQPQTHLMRLRFAALTVCMVAFQFATENSAFASCGDWLADVDMSAEHANHGDAGDSQSPLPCNGPQCRKSPERPLPSGPTRAVTVELERWCQFVTREERTFSEQSTLIVDGSLILPEVLRNRLDRPPRV